MKTLPLTVGAFAASMLVIRASAAAPAKPLTTVAPGVTATTPLTAPAGAMSTGPRSNGTAVLPNGRLVTPFGRTTTVDLLPTQLVLSHDGTELYATSEGMDSAPHANAYADHDFNRFVTVLDARTLRRTQHLADDNLHHGLAESADGRHVFVADGHTGMLGELTRTHGRLTRTGQTSVGPGRYPWGLAISRDGRTAYVGGFSDDSLTVVDTAQRKLLGSVPTGSYPTDVQLSPDGRRLYVLNTGTYNQDADDAPASSVTGHVPVTLPSVAGYNSTKSSSLWIYDVSKRSAPKPIATVSVGRPLDGTAVVSGSLPSHVAVSPDGKTLAVTAANDDLLELRDAVSGDLRRSIDLRMVANGPTGAQPTGVAWAPDGRTLYVAEAGRDAVAVLDTQGMQKALIPTAWYPMALALSRDGRHLYVASAKGFGAGPNDIGPSHGADKMGTDSSYIVNRLKGAVQDVDLTAAACEWPTLTKAVLRNNGLVPTNLSDPSGGVVPPAYGKGSDVIRHVVYIVKENRTYDQVFGDVKGTERLQRVAPYSGKVTPNHHAIAAQFAMSDNHYTTSQTSYDGHYIADSGQSNAFATQLAPLSYSNKLPHDRFVTNPENLPEGGFLWNNLARAGKSFRVYGEATYLVGMSPTALNAGGTPTNPVPPAFYALGSGGGGFSTTYPSQVTEEVPVTPGGGNDEAKADDFLRELKTMSTTGQMPSLLQLILPDDHTDGARPGSPTPQTYLGENDHALGRIVDGLSKSPFWASTAVFVVEDDTQDGQDHVDASRSLVLVAGGHVRKGFVSHRQTSTLSVLKTMDLILGVPPMSVEEMTSTSLADMFTATTRSDTFTARPNLVGTATNPSYPKGYDQSLAGRAAQLMARIPRGIDRGGPALQQSLILQNQAAIQAGSSQVPPQPDVAEHHLDRSSPAPLAQSCR